MYAFNPNGTLKWKCSFPSATHLISSVAIGDDGTLYFGSTDTIFYTFYPNGTKKWKIKTEWQASPTPAIGDDGTIYVGSEKLYALNPDGTIIWEFNTRDVIKSSPAIGADGTIYVGCNDGFFYAINPDGILRWKYNMSDEIKSSPVIGAEGTIYVGCDDRNFYAFNPNGTLKWKTYTNMTGYYSAAIDSYGTIYLSHSSSLYAIGGSEINTPEAPINLDFKVKKDYINITWDKPIDHGESDITNYKIYRNNSDGEEILLDITSNITYYTDKNINQGETYSYRVSAVNREGEGNLSNRIHVAVESKDDVEDAPGFYFISFLISVLLVFFKRKK